MEEYNIEELCSQLERISKNEEERKAMIESMKEAVEIASGERKKREEFVFSKQYYHEYLWIDPDEPAFNQKKHDETCRKNRLKRKKRKKNKK